MSRRVIFTKAIVWTLLDWIATASAEGLQADLQRCQQTLSNIHFMALEKRAGTLAKDCINLSVANDVPYSLVITWMDGLSSVGFD